MYKENNRKVFEIMPKLPRAVGNPIKAFLDQGRYTIHEIHLRENSYQSILSNDGIFVLSDKQKFEKNPTSPLRLTAQELHDTVLGFCGGSLYTHSAELSRGYISLHGIRVGICGKGNAENGCMSELTTYTSLNIRFPHHVVSAADAVFEECDKTGADAVGGILVISPPGTGKTTFLRALASGLSGGFYDLGKLTVKRCCVVDERGEIYLPEAFRANLCDFITGLPKAVCISHLTRTMSPEYIICDEITDIKDANSILFSASRGIIFAASVHGRTLEDVRRRKSVDLLIKNGVFSTACELYTENGKRLCRLRKNIT